MVSGIPRGPAPVCLDGSWSLPRPDPLSDGSHNITAEQTDEAGNTSDPAMVTVTVDATAPEAPVIVAPAEGSVTNDSTPIVSGTGEAGAEVEVSIDGRSEEHTSELQSLMRISDAVFCVKKKNQNTIECITYSE